MPQKTLVRGRVFNPLSRTEWEYFDDGALVIGTNGRLEAVGEYATLNSTPGIEQTLDYKDFLLLPGLIDTHIHLPQLPIRGKSAGTLLNWLENYAFPTEVAFADKAYAQTLSTLFFDSLKANGTTTALVISSIHEASTAVAFEAAQAANLRIIMGKVMMDQNGPENMLETTKESVKSSTRLAEAWHGKNDDLLRYAFTPRFALSCSKKLLDAAGELVTGFPNSYLHSHLAENTLEVTKVKALYHNMWSYTEIYEKSGCLGPHTIMAHGIHLSHDEITFLHDTQTRISHCPTSNFFLKSGFFNVPVFQHRGIPFALGSDIGGGPDICMFRVMRGMDDIQLKNQIFVKPTEALYYGTLGGAEVLSLEEETGNLVPGKSADFIVVDVESLTSFGTADQSIEDTLSQLIYLGDGHLVMQTFVRGTAVYTAPDFTPGSASTRVNEPLLRPLQMR